MTKPATQGERLTVLEIEARMRAEATGDALGRVAEELRKMNARLDRIDTDIRQQNERLTAYENKGKGVLVGVGILGTGIGAGLLAALSKVLEWFK